MSSASPLSFPSKHSRFAGVRGGRVPRGEPEKLARDPFFAERGELERSLENVEPPRASGDEPSHAPAAAAASRARSAAAGNENFFSFGDVETRLSASASPGRRGSPSVPSAIARGSNSRAESVSDSDASESESAPAPAARLGSGASASRSSDRPRAIRMDAWCVSFSSARNGWSKNCSKDMRRVGSFCKSPRIKSTHSLDRVVATAPGTRASPRVMFRRSCIGLAPVNGGFPHTSSKRIHPTLQRSALASYFW